MNEQVYAFRFDTGSRRVTVITRSEETCQRLYASNVKTFPNVEFVPPFQAVVGVSFQLTDREYNELMSQGLTHISHAGECV